MQFTKSDNLVIIKVEKGEEVVETLTKLCVAENIVNATFSGIGAVDELTCGYYALSEKKYYFTDYHELVEVVSLTGNVMQKDGEPFIHVHGVFTDTKNSAFGGHIVKMRVGVVLEVFMTRLPTKIERVHDECIGLHLMDIKVTGEDS